MTETTSKRLIVAGKYGQFEIDPSLGGTVTSLKMPASTSLCKYPRQGKNSSHRLASESYLDTKSENYERPLVERLYTVPEKIFLHKEPPPVKSDTTSIWPHGGIPILFPVCGRSWHNGRIGKYMLHEDSQGRSLSGISVRDMPIHGFQYMQSTPAKITHNTAGIHLVYQSTSATRKLFPWDYTLEIHYFFTQKGAFCMEITVTNKGYSSSGSQSISPTLNRSFLLNELKYQPPLPMAGGLHPYFRILETLSSKTNYSSISIASESCQHVSETGAAMERRPFPDDDLRFFRDPFYQNLIVEMKMSPYNPQNELTQNETNTDSKFLGNCCAAKLEYNEGFSVSPKIRTSCSEASPPISNAHTDTNCKHESLQGGLNLLFSIFSNYEQNQKNKKRKMYWVLWGETEKKFYCIEPWVDLPDSINHRKNTDLIPKNKKITLRLEVAPSAG